jgi:hypothetical protein
MGRNDLLALGGALVFIGGVAWVFPPAALMLGGLLVMAVAISGELF